MSQSQADALKLGLQRTGAQPSREEVLRAVAEQISLLERGLEIIDRGLPLPDGGEIDLIAVDGSGHLVLINVGLQLDARALSRLFVQADWIAANSETLNHFYKGPVGGCHARLMCLVSGVLPEALSLFERLDEEARPEIFTYDCLDLAGERWLVLRPFVFPREKIVNRPSAVDNVRPLNSIVTPEEIDDFFVADAVSEMEVEEEEVTN
jgi:hypothetical protein